MHRKARVSRKTAITLLVVILLLAAVLAAIRFGAAWWDRLVELHGGHS